MKSIDLQTNNTFGKQKLDCQIKQAFNTRKKCFDQNMHLRYLCKINHSIKRPGRSVPLTPQSLEVRPTTCHRRSTQTLDSGRPMPEHREFGSAGLDDPPAIPFPVISIENLERRTRGRIYANHWDVRGGAFFFHLSPLPPPAHERLRLSRPLVVRPPLHLPDAGAADVEAHAGDLGAAGDAVRGLVRGHEASPFFLRSCSSARRARLSGRPPPKPPSSPELAMTRCQGTTRGTGLRCMAWPTARKARGRPASLATQA